MCFVNPLRDRGRQGTITGKLHQWNSAQHQNHKYLINLMWYQRIIVKRNHVYVLSYFSHAQLFATSWTVACQAPLPMGFSRQEYWRKLPFPSLGDLPNPGIEPVFSCGSCIAGRFFTTEPPGKPKRNHDQNVSGIVFLWELGLEDIPSALWSLRPRQEVSWERDVQWKMRKQILLFYRVNQFTLRLG